MFCLLVRGRFSGYPCCAEGFFAATWAMTVLNPDLLSEELSKTMSVASELAGSRLLTPEYLLLAFIRTPECAAFDLLARLSEERGFKLKHLEHEVERAAKANRGLDGGMFFLADGDRRVPLSRKLIEVLDEALSVAHSLDEVWIGSDHALGTMCDPGIPTAPILRRYGITTSVLRDIMTGRVLRRKTTTQDVVASAREGQFHAVYFRERLLSELINILTQKWPRHVILIGPPGAGKRTLGYSLGLLMAEGKGPTDLDRLVTVEEAALLDNPVMAIQSGLKRAKGGILFVPHIHRFFGGTFKAEFPKAGVKLQKALLGDDPVIMGTTTYQDYKARLESSAVVAERTHRLQVEPPDVDETVEILRVKKPHLEVDYGLQIEDEALQVAARLASRYLSETALPRSAEQLLHRACALVSMSAQPQLPFRPITKTDTRVDAEDVTLAASQMTGIPVNKLGEDERTRYASMVEHLHERLIGQDEAVMAVSRAVKAARVGLKDPKRPIGAFLFLGPTGVGKTELAKALAEFMFGSEEAIIALDMSEYQDESTVSRLIGAPPGYVGYEGGGQLTERVRRRPYSVVLFDEVEKAHPRVLDILLQVIEEGRLTDGQGNTVPFGETVIILTSNLGARYLTEPVLSDETRAKVMAEVRAHFRPEFLNRLDDIVIFHPLAPEHLRAILDLMLKKEAAMATGRGLSLRFTDAAREWMLSRNTHPEWGARPLRRIIRRYVREPLADFLLRENPPPGTLITVDAGDDMLTFAAGQEPVR